MPDPTEDLIARAMAMLRLLGIGNDIKLPPIQATRPPNTVSPRLQELIESPFIQDTIMALLGNPPARFKEAKSENGGGVLGFIPGGAWEGMRPIVAITPEGLAQEDQKLQGTLAHELAHIASKRSPSYREQLESVPNVNRATGTAQHRPAQHPAERHAYAFENAVTLMRTIDDSSRREWLTRAKIMEVEVPGTLEMVQNLVKNPMFSQWADKIPTKEQLDRFDSGPTQYERAEFRLSSLVPPEEFESLKRSIAEGKKKSNDPSVRTASDQDYFNEINEGVNNVLNLAFRYWYHEKDRSSFGPFLRDEIRYWGPDYPGLPLAVRTALESPTIKDQAWAKALKALDF